MRQDHAERPIERSGISRRGLLKWTAAALAGTAALGTTACAGFDERELSETGGADSTAEEGRWIPCNCWADCGSKGFNKVYVSNGEAVRMGTDKTHEDTPDCPQLRSCARGRALRGMVFGADRIKYPMKRKNWQPGGGENAHGELRGRDEWERITWDEAYTLIAGEIERVIETYGNEGIFLPGCCPVMFGDFDIGRLLALKGGYIDRWGSVSSGAWGPLGKIYGLAEDCNDRFDLRKSQLIVLWGSNPAWSRTGAPTYDYMQCKEAGAEFAVIDIFYTPTAQALTDDFIGVRPGTDTALLLAMCYVLITQDDSETNPLIDWDFVNRCTIGFDADSMPEGADAKDNFKDYVLGTYDGTPKTPEWAAEICGATPAAIEEMALRIAKTERVSIITSPAPARTTNGMAVPQAFMAFGALAGCIGKEGCCTGCDAGHAWLQGGYLTLLRGGSILGEPSWTTAGNVEWITNPLAGDPTLFGAPNGPYKHPELPGRINVNEAWTGILNGEYTTGFQQKTPCKVHMIYDRHENDLNQAPGTMLAIEAYRKVDTVVAQNIVMTSTCQYADIVLPVTTQWERYGDVVGAYREQMLWTSQVCEPLFEAKSDIDIAAELAEYIGVDPKQVRPLEHKQQVVNWVAACEVAKEDGSGFEPLVAITEEDLAELGVEGTPQQGRVPILDFKRDGIFTYERHEGDGLNYIPLKAFREDPEANPISTTVSGKMELYCQEAVDRVHECGFSEIAPIAKYEPAIEGYEETYSDWENKVKGEYPFQLVGVHIPRHSHSTFANVPNLREAFEHPLYMNPVDAEALGMETGETVLITSKWGKSLRPLLVTEIMMPGVLAMGQGAWVDIDEETGIDRAGSVNVLIGPNLVGHGHQAWNSCIVRVDKWDGEPLEPDYLWEPYEVFKED